MTVATDMLARYLAAETAILEGQECRWEDSTLKMADLEWVQKGRREWEAKVAAESARSARTPTIGGLGFAVARFDE